MSGEFWMLTRSRLANGCFKIRQQTSSLPLQRIAETTASLNASKYVDFSKNDSRYKSSKKPSAGYRCTKSTPHGCQVMRSRDDGRNLSRNLGVAGNRSPKTSSPKKHKKYSDPHSANVSSQSQKGLENERNARDIKIQRQVKCEITRQSCDTDRAGSRVDKKKVNPHSTMCGGLENVPEDVDEMSFEQDSLEFYEAPSERQRLEKYKVTQLLDRSDSNLKQKSSDFVSDSLQTQLQQLVSSRDEMDFQQDSLEVYEN